MARASDRGVLGPLLRSCHRPRADDTRRLCSHLRSSRRFVSVLNCPKLQLPRETNILRDELGISDSATIFLYLGKFLPVAVLSRTCSAPKAETAFSFWDDEEDYAAAC